jgi:putative transcriptional regulator
MIRFRLEQLLSDYGWTAYHLSKECGIHPSVLSKYRHNQVKQASLETLDAICKALGCQAGDLIEYVADTNAGKEIAAPGIGVSAQTAKTRVI